MHNQPLVSVFIPYYNDREFLIEAIESVLGQTYKNFELILLNHASTDDSKTIARSFDDERIVHIDMKKNYGAGGGILFEQLLQTAKGKYLKLFCADDLLLPDALEKLVDYMESNPDKDFAFGDMLYVNSRGKSLKQTWFGSRRGFDLDNDELDTLKLLAEGCSHLPYPASIIKREAFAGIDIDKVFIMLFDMSLWIKLLIKGKKIGFLPQIVCKYRISNNQVSGIANKGTAIIRSFFELIPYCKMFQTITDVKTVRSIFPDNYLLKNLKEKDTEYIPFIVAYNCLLSPSRPYQIFGFVELYNMLSDDNMRSKIEARFDFDIGELRRIYSVSKIFELPFPNPKHMGIRQLVSLLGRQLLYLVLCRKNRKGKKEYSL
ncbi:MAG: glycosyltransferase [Candidatus Gastranaerophilales bacterium]|nr:glycosyltransferase [Candidatus Gastranaerophilales bacterium]